MRTTLTIDDDVLEAARRLAEEDALTLGEAVSCLARRGLSPASRGSSEHHLDADDASIGLRHSPSGLKVFDIPPGFAPVTSEDVARLLADFP